MDRRQLEPALLHLFKNHLSVIFSFSEFVLTKVPEGDLRDDITEIRNASAAALKLLPDLAEHYKE
jgi:hypothetical protein